MVNTNYKTTEDMIKKLQQIKGKTKLKFYKSLSNLYDEMKHKKIQTQQDPFAKNAQGISKKYHEVLFLIKFLQTKSKVKNMIINYYDLYYTVIKNRDEIAIVNNKNEKNENDYINFKDFITPNHNISTKSLETILR